MLAARRPRAAAAAREGKKEEEGGRRKEEDANQREKKENETKTQNTKHKSATMAKKRRGNKKKAGETETVEAGDVDLDDIIPPSLRAKIEAEEAAAREAAEAEEAQKAAASSSSSASSALADAKSNDKDKAKDVLSFGYSVDSEKMDKMGKKIQKQIEEEQEFIRQRKAAGGTKSLRFQEIESILSFVEPLGLRIKQVSIHPSTSPSRSPLGRVVCLV